MVSRGKTREMDSVSTEAEIPEMAVKDLLENNYRLYQSIAELRKRVTEIIGQEQPFASIFQTPSLGLSLEKFLNEYLEEERSMIQEKKKYEKRISSLIEDRIRRGEFNVLENRIIDFFIEGMGIGEAALRVAEESEDGKYKEAVKKVKQVMEIVKKDLGIQ